jgi:uncharacterized protein YuzE
MSALSIQVTYRRGKASVAYIDLDHRAGASSVRQAEVAPDIIVDFGDDESPIGIEIVDPERVTVPSILSVFDKLGLDRPDERELAPLDAA